MTLHLHLFPAVAQTVPDLSELPLLDELVEQYKNIQPLRGWRCLFIQHQLGDVCCQAEAMLALGIAAEDFFWVPIPYTAHPVMPKALSERTGVPLSHFFESSYTLRTNYDDYMNRVVGEQIASVVKDMSEGERLLVVDDGAYFTSALISDPTLNIEVKKLRVAIVEQTQRGIIKMEKIGLPSGMPIIDVAQSPPKKNIEPRYIAEAVVRGTCRSIAADAEAKSNADDAAVLLLGYGAIGRAVAQALVAIGLAGHLQVWDVDHKHENQVHTDGWTWWKRDGKTTFDYVIGCTGQAALHFSDLDVMRHGSMLINAASGRHELPVDQLLASDEVQMLGDRDSILDSRNIQVPLHFILPKQRHVTVANGGLPITFCGDLNPTRPEKFDVTSCCMVYASMQAVIASENGVEGLVPLDADFCHWVTDGWVKYQDWLHEMDHQFSLPNSL
jgi:S-adenosylhomocysteine hydrolase